MMNHHQFAIWPLSDEMKSQPLQPRPHLNPNFINARKMAELFHWADNIRLNNIRQSPFRKPVCSPGILNQCPPFLLYLAARMDRDRAIISQRRSLNDTAE